MRRRSKSFPFSLSDGYWALETCMLKADPHTTETDFHAHHEVTRLNVIFKSRFASSYKRESHPKYDFITTGS